MLVTQSCPALCNPGAGAHQAPLSMGFTRQNAGVGSHSLLRGSSWPRDRIWVSCNTVRFFAVWDTKEAHNLRDYMLKRDVRITETRCIDYLLARLSRDELLLYSVENTGLFSFLDSCLLTYVSFWIIGFYVWASEIGPTPTEGAGLVGCRGHDGSVHFLFPVRESLRHCFGLSFEPLFYTTNNPP